MGRLSNVRRQEIAREKLLVTIRKISELEPILGGKWRTGMLEYYVSCLASLVLYQSGAENPTAKAVELVSAYIYESISEPEEGG